MEDNAKKAYQIYRIISRTEFSKITTAQLNVLYNIQCRMKRDEAYRQEVDGFATEEGEPLGKLIEGFFTKYNARHGLEIRDSLTEYLNPDMVVGGYFLIETYKGDGDQRVATEPTAFSVGDKAYAVLRLYSRGNNSPVAAGKICYTVKTDDGDVYEGEVQDTDTVELSLSLSRPGWVYFNAKATDSQGNALIGFDEALGGILFDFEKITRTKEAPADLEEFWGKAIDRTLAIDPTDPVPDGYEGLVEYEYDMPKENHFKLVKLDSDYVQRLREYGIVSFDDSVLDAYDMYEVNLKAPGPCHSSNYLTIPKGKDPKSLPILAIYDGYTAYPLYPYYQEDAICFHCSHHGYSLPNPMEGYYMKLREGVCKNYGLGNGEVNAMYEDVNDNYMLYLHLRNLQALRFITDPALSAMIPGLHETWNGEVKFRGGSMGGYQSICMAGLCTMFLKKKPLFKLIQVWVTVPAFCNLAGITDDRVPCMTKYTEGMEYFDAAHLSGYLNAPIWIDRVSLGDTTCGPTGIMAMFNNIPAGVLKEINFLQNSNHGTLPDPDKRQWSRYSFN